MRLDLVGADPALPASGEDLLSSRSNYLIGDDQSSGRPTSPTTAAVEYANVYDGIDVRYYGNQRQLEYDFIVAAGADPSQIQLRFRGHRSRLH